MNFNIIELKIYKLKLHLLHRRVSLYAHYNEVSVTRERAVMDFTVTVKAGVILGLMAQTTNPVFLPLRSIGILPTNGTVKHLLNNK